MCKVLKVSKNSYYSYLRHIEPKRDVMLDSCVEMIFKDSMQTYGTRRIKKILERKYGWVVSRRRLAKVMKSLNFSVKTKRRFKVLTTDSNHNLAVAPNRINQDFYVSEPNEVYVGDITYISTKEGWLYLATVIDLFARPVLGWAIDDSMHTDLITKALRNASHKRTTLNGAIFHSDRGSQYASEQFKNELKHHGMIQSMSAKGNCYDNAVAESFFHTLKTELIHHIVFETKQEAITTINKYINFYNRSRLHSYNNYYSPIEAELKWWQSQLKEIA
jgi:transposase InsO family protein